MIERSKQASQESDSFHYHVEAVENGEKQSSVRVESYWDAAALCHDYIQAVASMYNATHNNGQKAYPEQKQYAEEKTPQTIILEWAVEYPDGEESLGPTYSRVITCQDSDGMTDEEFSAAIKRGLEREGFPNVKVIIL